MTAHWIHPDAELVEHRDGRTRTLGSADLLELVRLRAEEWNRLDLTPGARVIVATGSRLGTLLDVAAAWEAGLVPVLLSDSLAPESCRILSAHTAAAAVRATPAAARSWAGAAARTVGRDPGAVLLDLRGHRALPEQPEPDPLGEPALVLATSGSTGLPKAVVHRRSSLLRNAAMHWSSVGEPEPGERYLLSQSLYFSSAFVCGVLGVLARGMQLSLLEPPFSVAAWRDAAAHSEVTHTALTPHLLLRILSAGSGMPGSLRQVTVGGDRLGRTAAGELRRSGVREVFATYGLTEAGPRVATNHLDGDPDGWDTLGEPLPGVRLRLADRSDGPGELLVSTPTAQAGRYRDGAFSAWPEGVDVPTGDLAEPTADGSVRLVGRARRVASVSGEKVYLGLVERVLAEHPAVGAVRVDTDPDGLLAAQVLPRNGIDLDTAELRRWCRGRLRAVEIPHRLTAVSAAVQLTK
ncbi:class I adenylate-forming enzyme family protein [Streptacidiphilus sp. EB103A]|uniref:class I adenylate-forming enzyme family protein n=1 Tax=Streptacidiphilus sp. EB103A TaxID=3156275 RepID=UPI003513CA7B